MDNEEVMEVQNLDEVPRKSNNGKVVIGIVILVAVLILVIWRLLSSSGNQKEGQFIAALAKYYTAVGKNDTNTIAKLTSENFRNRTSHVKIIPGKYDIYVYELERINDTNTGAVRRLLYSLNLTEDKTDISYLNEAFFRFESNKATLVLINNKFRGRKVTMK